MFRAIALTSLVFLISEPAGPQPGGGWQRAVCLQDAPAAPPVVVSVKNLIDSLTAEALKAIAAGRLEHAEPNIKSRFEAAHPGAAISSNELLTSLLTRQHDDPFIDAYIRWQLTSFDPKIPELDYQPLLDVIRAAPKMVENPKARRNVLAALSRAAVRPLVQEEVESLKQALRELQDEFLIAEEMNRPAIEWREWFIKQAGETGPRRYLWMIEEMQATIAAGWPVSAVKAGISRAFSDSISDASFTIDHRHMVLGHLSEMVGMERKWVKDVTILANGTVKPSFWSSRIDKQDVENWHKRLLGIE